jgi:hypothetical protein
MCGRLTNINIQYLARSENRYLAREDEIREEIPDDQTKEFGKRSFIPPSLTDSDQYWREVAIKCFALSTQLGPPTFFLTISMNPNWFDYYALRKGLGAFSDSATATLVFRLKLLGLMAHLQKSKTLGNLSAYVWRIEYQKRGLPGRRKKIRENVVVR